MHVVLVFTLSHSPWASNTKKNEKKLKNVVYMQRISLMRETLRGKMCAKAFRRDAVNDVVQADLPKLIKR